ncbi:MAG: hypothetical protein LBG27_08740 [Spirochaetaceae bacterium]|nr:hypothetical protein [Spirochaetaceae bacterium]
MQTRKFFLIGVTVLLGASLFLTGCDNPTAGDAGAAGKNVGFASGASVTDTNLAALFKAAGIVTLGGSVTSVAGIVPAGKKLAVSRADGTAVGGGLEVEAGGSVEVYEGAVLIAGGDTGGYIKGAAGSVYGDGAVVPPYVQGTAPTGYLVYNNSTAVNKAAGAAALIPALVAAILDAASPLTVYNLTGITAEAIPAGKTLNLLGAGNTVTASLDLASSGALVVKKGAKLAATGAVALTGNATAGITIDGALDLASDAGATTNTASYTLVKAGGGAKVLLNAAAGKITIPADTGTSGGASLAVTQYAGITLGAAGSIELGREASGNGAGKLALAAGATVGVFDDQVNSKLPAAANVAGSDDTASAEVDWASANASGVLTVKTISVYGTKGAEGYAVINKATALSS